MQEEIGKTAGAIWDALNTKGEHSLSELKKAIKGKEPAFNRVAGTRRPDCHYTREALFPNPLETSAREGNRRLLG